MTVVRQHRQQAELDRHHREGLAAAIVGSYREQQLLVEDCDEHEHDQ
jgi:hypothetical protein